MTGAVTSARCVSAGEGKVWPVRGAGVEGGTEGPGAGEAPVAAAAEAEAGIWTGPENTGHGGAGGEVRRSFQSLPLCRSVTPHPSGVRTRGCSRGDWWGRGGSGWGWGDTRRGEERGQRV